MSDRDSAVGSIERSTPANVAGLRRRAVWAFGLDVVAVVLFVAIGRRSHDEGGNVVTGALSVAAPFLIALAVGWLIGRVWRQPMSMRSGIVVWTTTVVLGLVLRRFVFDRGTAAAFVIVTTITLAVLLLGWRAIARALHRDGEVGDPARR